MVNYTTELEIQNKLLSMSKKQKRTFAYLLYCEGRRADEIAEVFDVSERTIFRYVKWGRENLKKDPPPVIQGDILFDTFRRRAMIYSKFKSISKDEMKAKEFLSMSKHLLELDSKILDWYKTVKISDANVGKRDLDDILKDLDNVLKGLSNEELEDIVNNSDRAKYLNTCLETSSEKLSDVSVNCQ